MPTPATRRRGPVLFVVGGVLAAAGAVAAGVGVLMSHPAASAPELPIPAATPPSAAVSPTLREDGLGGGPGCTPTRTPELVRGNGPGSTDSGPGAILEFQHGYYIDRLGSAARKVVAADAAVSSVEVIDAGIATIPPGTGHCITITPLAEHTYTVLITESRPDGTRRHYQQVVTVAVHGDRHLITRIGPVE